MITYLKHVGGKKHADLKNKNFDDIQALYERIKRNNDKFLAGYSTEDESKIKEMNEKAKDPGQKSLKKKVTQETPKSVDTAKVSDEYEDEDELRSSLIIVLDEDKEVDYEILDRKYPIIEWKSEYLTTKPQTDESKGLEEVNLNIVVRSNGQRRHFSTLMRGDLMIIFNQSNKDEFWNAQQDWKIVCWKLHSSSGVHTLMTNTGLVIHMLVENKYPLRKEILSQMIELKLESEEESTMALELIRFIKQQINEK
ncbi:hypothetical protein Tco_0651971 [Tanacetum coccineum]|uniref:Uncharacterized protein n=1 Tax=Tanacetum coccineum TaxID=301880 RepID=A0ABQ4WWB4_9ASTR